MRVFSRSAATPFFTPRCLSALISFRAFLVAVFLLSALLLSPAFLLPTVCQADYSVATIDMSRVLNEAPEAQKLREEIETMSEKARKKIETQRTTLQKLQEDLKTKKVAEDSKEAEDLRVKAREFSRLVKDSEDDLKKQFMKSNRELTEKILGFVEEYAKKKGYDLVLEKSANRAGTVLYGNKSNDITEEILKTLSS